MLGANCKSIFPTTKQPIQLKLIKHDSEKNRRPSMKHSKKK